MTLNQEIRELCIKHNISKEQLIEQLKMPGADEHTVSINERESELRSLGWILYFSSLFIFYLLNAVFGVNSVYLLLIWVLAWFIYNFILHLKGEIKPVKWLGWGFYAVSAVIIASQMIGIISGGSAFIFPIAWMMFNLIHGFILTPNEKGRSRGTRWTVYWTIIALVYLSNNMFGLQHGLLAYIAIWLADSIIEFNSERKMKKQTQRGLI